MFSAERNRREQLEFGEEGGLHGCSAGSQHGRGLDSVPE